MSAPNLKEVEWAISELEQEESSKAGYILLSALYNIRDKLSGEPPAAYTMPAAYSMQAAPTESETLGQYGDSDFLRSIAGKDSAAAWAVVDELMSTLKVANIRVYNIFMQKMKQI